MTECVFIFSYHRERGRELYKKVVFHGQSYFKQREMGLVHMGYFTDSFGNKCSTMINMMSV